jgi:aspartyl-tRNA(Asn)/glutamyl-tRNA(Gln) amidotransferase subunit A
VEDCAITIGGIAGYDPQDPSTHKVPVPDYQAALTGDIKGLKVGVIQELIDPQELDLDPQMRQAVLNAIEVLAELGADVRQVSMPLAEKTGYITRAITHVDRVSLHPEWLRERSGDYHYNTKVHFTTANLIPAQVYYKAQKLRTMVREQVLGLLEEVDVLVQPTSGAPANIINPDQKVDSQDQARKALSAGGFRGPYSLSGAPALSILCGFTSDGDGGLPLAMQIAGRPFDEATVLRVAHAYEQAAGWIGRMPPAAL